MRNMPKDSSLLILLAAAELFVLGAALPPANKIRCPVCEYPNEGTGINVADEDTLDCQRNDASSVIHKRFWFEPITVRRCSCEDLSHENRRHWQEIGDDYTMFINPRAQLKFCNPVAKELPQCTENTVALTTTLLIKLDSISGHQTGRHSEVTAKCFCPKQHYYKLLETVVSGNKPVKKTQTYACKPYEKCHTGDFCGYITAKGYQTYYVCTCPQNHLCVMKDRMKFRVMEALFEGEAYRGHCVPWKRARKP